MGRPYQGGTLTKKGYLRTHPTNKGKQFMVHRLVWEKHYGKIPEGFQIHHIDEDKTNNEITNLRLVTPLEHKRIHSKCEIRKGEWWKPCNQCKIIKSVKEDYYKSREWIQSICKQCQIDNSTLNKKKRHEKQCESR